VETLRTGTPAANAEVTESKIRMTIWWIKMTAGLFQKLSVQLQQQQVASFSPQLELMTEMELAALPHQLLVTNNTQQQFILKASVLDTEDEIVQVVMVNIAVYFCVADPDRTYDLKPDPDPACYRYLAKCVKIETCLEK